MKAINLSTLLLLLLYTQTVYCQGLETFLEYAKANHPGLKATYSRYQAVTERVNQVGILPDPTLSAGVFISPVETRVGPQIMKLSLAQRFPWFGTLKAEKSVLKQKSLIALESYDIQWREIEYKVTSSWYQLNNVYQLIKFHQELLSLHESLHDITLTKFEAGTTSLANVLRIQMVIDELKINIEGLQDLLDTRKRNFNLLVNRPTGETIILPDSIISQETILLPGDSIARHPRLRQLTLEQEELEANLDLVNYRSLPGLGIGLDYVLTGERTDMAVEDNGKDVFMPMVSISLPIFRKKYRSMKDEIHFEMEANTNRLESERINLTSAYEMAEWQYYESVRNVVLYEELIEKSDQVATLLITEFSVSGEYLSDVLDIHQDILKYKIKQLNALTDRYVAAAKIKQLTGL